MLYVVQGFGVCGMGLGYELRGFGVCGMGCGVLLFCCCGVWGRGF